MLGTDTAPYMDMSPMMVADQIYEDNEDVTRLYLPCAGEYYLGSGARFENNTLYREFNLTVLQIVDTFGVERCRQKAFKEGSVDLEFVIGHAIEPNFPISNKEKDGTKVEILPAHFTFREVYWLKGNKTEKTLSVRGFRECPFSVLKWAKVSNEPYSTLLTLSAILVWE